MDSKFLQACEENQVSLVRNILDRKDTKPRLDSITDDNGWTGLHYATFNGSLEVGRILLAREFDVDCPSDGGITSLHLASQEGHGEFVKELLRKGANVHIQDNDGFQAMHHACLYDHTNVVEILISEHETINAKTSNGSTPLMITAKSGSVNCARILLEHEANCELEKPDGWRAVHVATDMDNDEILRLLILSGANLETMTNDGESAIHMAVKSNKLQIANTMFEACPHLINHKNREGWEPLHIACYHGFTNMTDLLIGKGASMETMTPNGYTALHMACQEGNDCVSILLRHNAPVNIRGDNGMTPLHVTCQHDHPHLVQPLVANGADIDAQTEYGSTPLLIATQIGSLPLVTTLLKSEADPKLARRNGWTPLHAASSGASSIDSAKHNPPFGVLDQHFAEISKLLLESCPDADVRTEEGATPLMVATETSSYHCVETLLERGAGPTLADMGEWQPLHLAAHNGNALIIKVLLEKCSTPTADSDQSSSETCVNAVTSDGSTSLMLAAKSGSAQCVKLLLDYNSNTEIEDSEGTNAINYATNSNIKDMISSFRKKHQGEKIGGPVKDSKVRNLN